MLDRFRFSLPVLLLAVLAACKTPPGVHPPTRAKASVAVNATSPPATSSPAARLEALQAPKDGGLPLGGTIQVDAAYLLATGQGRLIANNGGNAVVLEGSPLASDQGGSIIANNGGGIIANNGGGIAPPALGAGSRLLTEGGLGLIGRTGLLTEGGLGLTGKTKRGLLEAATPVSGDPRPAAGMLVGVVSLATGKLLPIGQDPGGKDVYAVLTGTDGRYQLYLPKATSGNVRVVALPPTSTDVRLQYGAVLAPAKASGQPRTLDEAEALASAFLRIQMTRFLDRYLAQDEATNRQYLQDQEVPTPLLDPALQAIEAIRAIADKHGYAARPPAERQVALQQVVDAMLEPLDLDQLLVNTRGTAWTGPAEPALPAMAGVVRLLSARTATLLAKDPHFFDAKPYMTLVNRQRVAAGAVPIGIRRPDDLAAVALGEFFTGTDGAELLKLDEVLADVGLPASERAHLRAAAAGIYTGLFLKLFTDEDYQATLRQRMEEVFAAPAAPGAPPSLEPGPAPPQPATEAAPRVTTLLGDGSAGDGDGPAAAARVAELHGLALREGADGLALYFTDNHRIRCLARAADGSWSVTAVAGGSATGNADGPGASASFYRPQALAVDHLGRLLVAEAGAGRIRRVDLRDPANPVTTLAGGSGDGTDRDGSGTAAVFSTPRGLAELPDGTILVATAGGLVRRLDPAASGIPVTTLSGSSGFTQSGALAETHFSELNALVGLADGRAWLTDANALYRVQDGRATLVAGNRYEGRNEGFWADARLRSPGGLAVDAAGTVFIADTQNHRILKATPLGDIQQLAGEVLVQGTKDPATGGGFADGVGPAARFNAPEGIAVDARGNLYVADTGNRRIRLVERGP